jgi:hypothetical protein
MGADGVLIGSVDVNDDHPAFALPDPLMANSFKSPDGRIQYIHFKAPHVENIVSVTGAGMTSSHMYVMWLKRVRCSTGDSLVGTTVWALIHRSNFSLPHAVEYGLIGAKFSLESPFAVSPLLSEQAVESVLQNNKKNSKL